MYMDTVLVSIRRGTHPGPGSWVQVKCGGNQCPDIIVSPSEPGAREVMVVVEADS